MIRKVSHLVKITHDPAAPKLPYTPPVYDETADAALLRKLAFDSNQIVPELYSVAEQNAGKKPDFKLLKNGQVCAFCEMKSPKDDFAFERPKPNEAAIRKNLPYHRKLAGHIRKAAQQLQAVNPDHASPNILAFVTHAPEIERRDLHATIAGLTAGDGRQLLCCPEKIKQGRWTQPGPSICTCGSTQRREPVST
jgi:hypothetical protein